MSKKITRANKIKQPYYYVIKVVLGDIGKTVYKVGETLINDKRPKALVEKYEDRKANKAEVIQFAELPVKHQKRINDKILRSALLKTKKFKRADVNELEVQLRETDGINEFVYPTSSMTDEEIIAEIQTTLNSLKPLTASYTTKVRYYTELVYDPSQRHLVSATLITEKIFKYFPKIKECIYNISDQTPIVLIGQFEPQFIATFAMFKKVVIWHDTADQIYDFAFTPISSNITYVETLEDLIEMDLTSPLIIANTPYGKPGALITDAIIHKMGDYKYFINLLPMNDYKRWVPKLYQFVREMTSIDKGFADAAVTTHLCEIVKVPNSLTAEEFEVAQYIDPKLTKYFTEQLKRTHYAIDNATYKPKLKDFEINFDLRRCLFIGKRYISDEHIPYTKNCAGYKVNIGRTITPAELIAISAKSEQENGNVGDFLLAQFDTVQEQNNITDFLYSPQGFKFFAKVVVAMNLDSYAPLKKFIPKVDWTRSWTVEEILADYGYTEDEITGVMADLETITGMED